MQRHWIIISAVLLGLNAASFAASVDAELSRSETYVGMPITLQVTVANASSPTPPKLPTLPGLKIQYHGPRGQSTFVTVINNRTTRRQSISYHWTLLPTQPGNYTLPAMDVLANGKTFRTNALTFTVKKNDVGDKLFVEIQGEKKHVYVGQALPVTLTILVKPYHNEKFNYRASQKNMWSLVSGDHSRWGIFLDPLVKQCRQFGMPKCQNVLRKNDKGIEEIYYQYSITATFYPQKPGTLSMDDVYVLLKWPTGIGYRRDFFGEATAQITGYRPLVKVATIKPMNVKSLPADNRPAFFAGAVGTGYAIAAAAGPTNVRVGDPVQLELTLSGPGRLGHLKAPPVEEMPEMTRRFKIPDEDLAGVVRGEKKYFNLTLRPRDVSVTEIPPIPLVSFDPETETFKTIYTQAIPLTVRPAEKLAGSDIVSADGPDEQTDTRTPTPPWYTDNATLLAPPAGLTPPVKLGLLLLGPAVALLALATTLLRKRFSQPAQKRARHAKTSSMKSLQRATTPEQIGSAITQFLADKFNAPPGLTGEEAAGRLAALPIDTDTVDDLKDLMKLTQHAQFALSQNDTVDDFKTRARRLISQLNAQKALRKNGGDA